MQRLWVGIGHGIERAVWSDAHAYAVIGPCGNHCFDDLKEETGSVFDRTTIFIRTLITAVLKKLVNKIPVACMNLDPSKPADLARSTALPYSSTTPGISDFSRARCGEGCIQPVGVEMRRDGFCQYWGSTEAETGTAPPVRDA